ncbi:MAG: dTMP kinase [Spirochaetaceae bacterium]|jgi:dTMP kinase|nr:dTMP kinase [Spirochaetaceae bacterium]
MADNPVPWYNKTMILQNFAVIEGCDGSGTTTQLTLLKTRFEISAFPFFATCEPTGGPVGTLIRRILRGETAVMKETMARLFAADRAEHLYAPGGIEDRCRRGELVVSDRYSPSSLVYQGIECGPSLPRQLNDSFPDPELLIYLDIDSGTALERLESRKNRDIYEGPDFQIRVRDAYRELLPVYEKAGVRVLFLDGTAPREKLAEEIWRALEEMPIFKKTPGNRHPAAPS